MSCICFLAEFISFTSFRHQMTSFLSWDDIKDVNDTGARQTVNTMLRKIFNEVFQQKLQICCKQIIVKSFQFRVFFFFFFFFCVCLFLFFLAFPFSGHEAYM